MAAPNRMNFRKSSRGGGGRGQRHFQFKTYVAEKQDGGEAAGGVEEGEQGLGGEDQ